MRSTPGSGSSFTLYLPLTYVGPSTASAGVSPSAPTSLPQQQISPYSAVRLSDATPERVPDDRETLEPEDAVLLIVEDDPHYARVMSDLAREEGFKVLVAMRGAEALDLARQYHPVAVSLDVFLPDMLGWTVLSHLKQDPALRHIPVQIVTLDEDRQHGLARGAFSFVTKPTTTEGLEEALARIKEYATPRRRRLLVVEDNAAEQMSIRELLGHDDIDIEVVGTGSDALAKLRDEAFDCAVLDLRLPDMSGFEVLERLRDEDALRDLPVIVFTGKELSPDEDARLHTLARSVVVKGVESPERLLDETALFLHRVVADLPPEKQAMLDRLHSSDDDLVGRKVLVVDDDVRNIFALSSVLERRGMTVLTAGTGSYSGLGFTVDSESREEYLGRLAALPEVADGAPDRRVKARQYAYALFLRRPWAARSFRLAFDYAPNGWHPLDRNAHWAIDSPDALRESSDLGGWADWVLGSSDADYVPDLAPDDAPDAR